MSEKKLYDINEDILFPGQFMVRKTQVCSVLKTFDCQLQEYVIRNGGIKNKNSDVTLAGRFKVVTR